MRRACLLFVTLLFSASASAADLSVTLKYADKVNTNPWFPNKQTCFLDYVISNNSEDEFFRRLNIEFIWKGQDITAVVTLGGRIDEHVSIGLGDSDSELRPGDTKEGNISLWEAKYTAKPKGSLIGIACERLRSFGAPKMFVRECIGNDFDCKPVIEGPS